MEVLRGERLRSTRMLDLQTPPIKTLLSFAKLRKANLKLLV